MNLIDLKLSQCPCDLNHRTIHCSDNCEYRYKCLQNIFQLSANKPVSNLLIFAVQQQRLYAQSKINQLSEMPIPEILMKKYRKALEKLDNLIANPSKIGGYNEFGSLIIKSAIIKCGHRGREHIQIKTTNNNILGIYNGRFSIFVNLWISR